MPELGPQPAFEPLHPKFTGKARVYAVAHMTGPDDKHYAVDLDRGVCSCEWGASHEVYSDKDTAPKWIKAKYCIHKLKVIAAIVEGNGSSDELVWNYLRALGPRYNSYEAVSAFHKELRRGDFQKAWYWGCILATHRGLKGVHKYLINILYEEGRDHELGRWLIDQEPTLANVCKGIAWFCVSPKKWQLPHRYDIFVNEMHGYAHLCDLYGNDVAKPGEIINPKEMDKLKGQLLRGAATDDQIEMQIGLKGLQKLKTGDPKNGIVKLRAYLLDQLLPVGLVKANADNVSKLYNYIAKRSQAGFGIGYHELNAFADLIAGEPYDAGLTPAVAVRAIKNMPRPAPFPLNYYPQIPLYAQDNHTYRGKALMKQYAAQLKPGVEQTHLDFRLCGAYYGVAYRMQAFKQFGNLSEWHKVKWDSFLYKTVDRLWY